MRTFFCPRHFDLVPAGVFHWRCLKVLIFHDLRGPLHLGKDLNGICHMLPDHHCFSLMEPAAGFVYITDLPEFIFHHDQISPLFFHQRLLALLAFIAGPTATIFCFLLSHRIPYTTSNRSWSSRKRVLAAFRRSR